MSRRGRRDVEEGNVREGFRGLDLRSRDIGYGFVDLERPGGEQLESMG